MEYINLFTYGTLMDEALMEQLTGKRFKWCGGMLYDYRKLMVKEENFPGIIAFKGDMVKGRLYFGVDNESLKRINEYEDEFYELKRVSVHTDNGKNIDAYTYVIKEEFKHLLSD